MTPFQFVSRVKKGDIPAVSLFIGQESYNRRLCREALVKALKLEAEIHDSAETSLAAIIDDARALSLFASERLIILTGAETFLPRSLRGAAAAEEDDDEGGGSTGDESVLASYVKDPTPGVTLILEATRWDLEGEEKAKSERVRKFYSAIPDAVEFRKFDLAGARVELDRIAKAANLQIEPAAAEQLVEALAGDVARIAVEVEKLSLFGKPITAAELPALVPDARQSTIFALVAAIGRRDRAKSLEALDSLVREGEYLPLALTFHGTGREGRRAAHVLSGTKPFPAAGHAHVGRTRRTGDLHGD
jgi:DNA polymerase-3 subunit delta